MTTLRIARFVNCAFVALSTIVAGCASTDIPKPTIGEVRTQTVNVGVPVLCPKDEDLPPRRASAMVTETADVNRLIAGATADARGFKKDLEAYEAARRKCADVINNGGKPQ